MKATGIVRRIDDLGRIVIPKEIRRTMRIREGDPLEIYTSREGEVIFKKYSLLGGVDEFAEQLCETLSKHTGFLCAVADRDEFCRKCLLLLAACGVLAVFVRDGELSYTGTGLLMLLFVLFVMMSIVFQHKFTYGDTIKAVSTSEKHPSPQLAAQEYGYTAHTMAFPVMNVRNALTNLAGVVGGLALLAGGAQALLYSATTLANLTGTIQALWAATLISFGFCIPLLVEALNHPLGSVWKWFSVRCRYYPPDSLPIQLLNSAILNLTLALPISSLMYRHKLPVGAQFRSYEVPVCAAMALVLLLPPLCRHKLKRGQGWMCLALYFAYLAAALLLPRAGA